MTLISGGHQAYDSVFPLETKGRLVLEDCLNLRLYVLSFRLNYTLVQHSYFNKPGFQDHALLGTTSLS